MKKLLLLTALFIAGVSFGQSKKEQIEILTNRVDSLNTVLSTTRDNASKDVESRDATIDGLNSEIAQLKSDVSSLESSVSTLEKDKAKLTRENEKFKTDLEEMSKKNLELEAKINEVVAKWTADKIEDKIVNGSDCNAQITLMDGKGIIASFYNWNENYTDGSGEVEISQKLEWVSGDTYFEYTYHKYLVEDGDDYRDGYQIQYNLYGWDFEKDQKIIFPQWTRNYEFINGQWKETSCSGNCY